MMYEDSRSRYLQVTSYMPHKVVTAVKSQKGNLRIRSYFALVYVSSYDSCQALTHLLSAVSRIDPNWLGNLPTTNLPRNVLQRRGKTRHVHIKR